MSERRMVVVFYGWATPSAKWVTKGFGRIRSSPGTPYEACEGRGRSESPMNSTARCSQQQKGTAYPRLLRMIRSDSSGQNDSLGKPELWGCTTMLKVVSAVGGKTWSELGFWEARGIWEREEIGRWQRTPRVSCSGGQLFISPRGQRRES
jgi:hypothetical protein